MCTALEAALAKVAKRPPEEQSKPADDSPITVALLRKVLREVLHPSLRPQPQRAQMSASEFFPSVTTSVASLRSMVAS
jgi:hypothetical protein